MPNAEETAMVSGATVVKGECATLMRYTVMVASVAQSTGLRAVERAWCTTGFAEKITPELVVDCARKWYEDTGQSGEAHLEMDVMYPGDTRRFAVECAPWLRVNAKTLPVPGPDGEERVRQGERPLADLASVAELLAVRCARAAQGVAVCSWDEMAKEIGELAKCIKSRS